MPARAASNASTAKKTTISVTPAPVFINVKIILPIIQTSEVSGTSEVFKAFYG
jgi:hypothetical protein